MPIMRRFSGTLIMLSLVLMNFGQISVTSSIADSQSLAENDKPSTSSQMLNKHGLDRSPRNSVPGTLSEQNKLTLAGAGANELFQKTTTVGARYIDVYYPDGTESYYAGAQVYVEWHATGIDNVGIDLYQYAYASSSGVSSSGASPSGASYWGTSTWDRTTWYYVQTLSTFENASTQYGYYYLDNSLPEDYYFVVVYEFNDWNITGESELFYIWGNSTMTATSAPTGATSSPKVSPTASPTTSSPMASPTALPTTSSPMASPTTSSPTASFTGSASTDSPTAVPTLNPTISQTRVPTKSPTKFPTNSPTYEDSVTFEASFSMVLDNLEIESIGNDTEALIKIGLAELFGVSEDKVVIEIVSNRRELRSGARLLSSFTITVTIISIQTEAEAISIQTTVEAASGQDDLLAVLEDAGLSGASVTVTEVTVTALTASPTITPTVRPTESPTITQTVQPTECGSHEQCVDTGFCSADGECLDCTECTICADGIDDTCGYCGPSYQCYIGCGYPGTYCLNGTIQDCGLGYYCPDFNMTDPFQCEGGNYCPGYNEVEQTLCEMTYYCPPTSYTQTECNAEDGDICKFTGLSEPDTCYTNSSTDLTRCYEPNAESCTTDTIDITCVCQGLYLADSMCTDKENIEVSFIVASITLLIVVLGACPCLCCDGVLLSSSRADKDVVYKNLAKVKGKSEILAEKRRKKLESQEATEEIPPKEDSIPTSTSDPNRLNGGVVEVEGGHGSRQIVIGCGSRKVPLKTLCFWTFKWGKFLVLYGGIFLISYVADIAKMIVNSYLIIKGIHYLDLTEMTEELAEALKGFLNEKLYWVADIYEFMIKVFNEIDFFSILEDMQVTCNGSQAPAKLCINLLVVVLIVFLYEAHFFPFLRVTFKRYTSLYGSGAQTKKDAMTFVLLKNTYLVFESSFKYFIQLGITSSSYADFFYSEGKYTGYHSYTSYCTISDYAIDRLFAILSTVLLIFFAPAMIHVVLRCFFWGLPEGIKFDDEGVYSYFPKRWRRLCCHTRAVHFKRDEFYDDTSKTDTVSLKHTLRDMADDRHIGFTHYHDDLPCMMDFLVLVVLGKEEGGRLQTMKKYLYVIGWKVLQMFKLTIGYWDDTLIKSFHIIEMGSRLCIEADEAPEQEVISMYGRSNSIVWQFVPLLTVVAKFGEYCNEYPLFVAEHVTLKNVDTGQKKRHALKLMYKAFDPEKKTEQMNWQQKLFYFASCVNGRTARWTISMVTFSLTVALAFQPVSTLMTAFCYFVLPSKILGTLQTMSEMGLLPEQLEFLADVFIESEDILSDEAEFELELSDMCEDAIDDIVEGFDSEIEDFTTQTIASADNDLEDSARQTRVDEDTKQSEVVYDDEQGEADGKGREGEEDRDSNIWMSFLPCVSSSTVKERKKRICVIQ